MIAIASQHLGEVERKIAALTALRGEIARMVESCKQGRVSECRVADHSHAHCVSDAHARPPAQSALAMEPLKR